MIEDQSHILQKWEVIRDTYTIGDYLGRGAFGQVYKARHRFMGLQAIKVFDPKIFGPESEGNLFAEARVLSKLTHENVVRVFDTHFFSKGKERYVYIAMELVNGMSLDRFYLEKTVGLSATLKICRGILRGLNQVHSQKPPIVHRDIKPQNILVEQRDADYLVKVSDFGLARYVNSETNLINAEGTLAFMAPEGFWDYETPASDVFSAGIVFYWMMTKQFPFKSPPEAGGYNRENLKNILIETRREKPIAPSKINPEIDPKIEQTLFKSLEFDIKKRFQTAGEFEEALKSCTRLKDGYSKDCEEAKILVEEAIELGKQCSTLSDAILKMEMAFTKDENLIPVYASIVDQWRKGMLM